MTLNSLAKETCRSLQFQIMYNLLDYGNFLPFDFDAEVIQHCRCESDTTNHSLSILYRKFCCCLARFDIFQNGTKMTPYYNGFDVHSNKIVQLVRVSLEPWWNSIPKSQPHCYLMKSYNMYKNMLSSIFFFCKSFFKSKLGSFFFLIFNSKLGDLRFLSRRSLKI